MLWLRSDCMSSRLLVRLFSALALAAIALISAPLTARADTGDIYMIQVKDDSGNYRYFIQRQFALDQLREEVSTSGNLAAGTVSGTISDIELSGSAGASNFTDGSFLGQRYLNDVGISPFWVHANNGMPYNMSAGGTSTSGKPSWYWTLPSFLVTAGRYQTPSTATSINMSGHLSGSSLNGGLGSRSLSLSDSDGLSIAANLAKRDISASSNVSGSSACALSPFIFFSSQLQFTSGKTYDFEILIPNGITASSYNPSSQFGLYKLIAGNPHGSRLSFFNLSSVVIANNKITCRATASGNLSYTQNVSDPLYLSLPDEYGVGVTQVSFLTAITNQTNSINQTATNNSNREIQTYMDTTGSNTVVGDVLGGTSSSDMSDSMGVGDALGIASGGLSSMLGRPASGVVTFSGLQLGAEFGNFEIPSFSVDIWSWCPEGLANTIKTGFTAVAVISWAVGMKRFFDRIFHGEQVVSVE